MLVMLMLIAQAQPLPAALQTVSLRITQIENDDHEMVYVVTSERFDSSQPAHVEMYRPRAKARIITGSHMKKIAEQIARNSQCVFVMAHAAARLDIATALAQSGVTPLPLLAGR